MSIFCRALNKSVCARLALAGALGLVPATAIAQQSVAPPAMQRWAPALALDTDQVLFGDVWRRSELGPRDRSLVTVAILVATGKTPQLEGHLGRALDNGVKPSEISGLVTHLAWYSGWPNAVSSLEVVDRVMRARGIAPDDVRVSGVTSPVPGGDPERARDVTEKLGGVAPKFAELTNERLFADLWRRPDLAPRDRSLITIAALAAAGEADQLAVHIARGLDNGLTPAQISEALTHLAFYAGWPRATAAITVLKTVRGDRLATSEPLVVTPPNQFPQPGPASQFTGSVTASSRFAGSGASRLSGATVTFRAGARTNWHRHALGQLFIVTAGEGRVQIEGGTVRTVRAGDTVWTAPNVRHWHGAAPDRSMTHVAVAETIGEKPVEWMEPVSAAEYRDRR